MLGSQFLITLAPDLQSLDGEHCVFGEISEGLEIILKLNDAICDSDHRPYQDIRISHTVVLMDPYEDPKGLIIPDGSPGPSKEVLMVSYSTLKNSYLNKNFFVQHELYQFSE